VYQVGINKGTLQMNKKIIDKIEKMILSPVDTWCYALTAVSNICVTIASGSVSILWPRLW